MAGAEIWSALPDLKDRPGFGTGPSRQPYYLSADQISPWRDFYQLVREQSVRHYGIPRPLPPTVQSEQYIVGNENGEFSRFVQHISEALSATLRSMGLAFGDPQAGTCTLGDQPGPVPDITIQCYGNPGEIRVVGEVKTYWTTDLEKMDKRKLAHLLGQLARYMDDYKTAYGFLTTYQQTVFLKRSHTFTFQVSPVVFHRTISTPRSEDVSLKECLFFMATIAAGNSWQSTRRVGRLLTTGTWTAQSLS